MVTAYSIKCMHAFWCHSSKLCRKYRSTSLLEAHMDELQTTQPHCSWPSSALRLGLRVVFWLGAALAMFWTGTVYKLHVKQVLGMGALKEQETGNWDKCSFWTTYAELGNKGLEEVGKNICGPCLQDTENDVRKQSRYSLIFPTIHSHHRSSALHPTET